MKHLKTIALYSFCVLSQVIWSQSSPLKTIFENSDGNTTATYKQTIDFYNTLANLYSEVSVFEMGKTDSGYPLHLVVFDPTKKFDFKNIRDLKTVILINNGIHPGEPDGIDASMMLMRDIAESYAVNKSLSQICIAIIPVYNIGGALNRNSTTRVNQNGPKEYGFRGNARNFDLNRDFIKNDTKNAKAFTEIFQLLNPDVFIETHVSNGADYQYTLTHLFTQHNKLGGKLGEFLETKMRPEIELDLLQKGISITPYVNVWGKSPDEGFTQFFDSPRYSSGYATLFNSFSFMIETHMLKAYKQRVEQTLELLKSAIYFTSKNSAQIEELRKNAVKELLQYKTYPIQFEVDKNSYTTFNFKGFESTTKPSAVTTGNRLFYDQSKPFTKEIKYYNQFVPSKEVTVPKAYILKQGYWPIIEKLKLNNIQFTYFLKDTTLTAFEQRIVDFKTVENPYEGHYLHFNTSVSFSEKTIQFSKGDIYIPTNQNGVRYLIETLESEAIDSFFNWNFFDAILQQKEGYSAYVFEDIAEQFLKDNPNIKEKLQNKISTDTDFANNPRAQLYFVYQNSPYFEDAYLKLPIYKVF